MRARETEQNRKNRTTMKTQNIPTLAQYNILLDLVAIESENDDKIIRIEFDRTKSKRKKRTYQTQNSFTHGDILKFLCM